MKHAMIFLFSLVLFSSVLTAADVWDFALKFSIGNCVQDVFALATSSSVGVPISLLLITMTLIISLAYMVGSVTGNANYTIFAKDELWHMLFSIFLLLGSGAILTFSCSFVNAFGSYTYDQLGANSQCYSGGHIDVSKLASCHFVRIENSMESMVKYNTQRMDANEVWGINYPFIGGVYTGLNGWKKGRAGQFDLLRDVFIIPAMVSVSIQKIFLEFIKEYMVTILLPFGLAFRFIPPLRDFGNLMIALSIGLFILFPLFATFNAMMYDAVFQDCKSYETLINDAAAGTCGYVGNLWDIAIVLPQAYFLPNLTIAVLITFVSSISKALKVIG